MQNWRITSQISGKEYNKNGSQETEMPWTQKEEILRRTSESMWRTEEEKNWGKMIGLGNSGITCGNLKSNFLQ